MKFKFRGKKYKIRKGGNLHAIMVLGGTVGMGLLGYVLLCLFVGLGNAL